MTHYNKTNHYVVIWSLKALTSEKVLPSCGANRVGWSHVVILFNTELTVLDTSGLKKSQV